MADLKLTSNKLLRSALGISKESSADKAALAVSGVGGTASVAAAQSEATVKAAEVLPIQKDNANMQPARDQLSGLTTRYTHALSYEGVNVLNVNQKDIMFNPVAYCDYLRLIELPRMVSMDPDSILFDEHGAASHKGAALAQNEFAVIGSGPTGLPTIQGENTDIFMLANSKGFDPIIGWDLTIRPYNVNRGTGKISLDYYSSGYTAGSWYPSTPADVAIEGTVRNNARIVLLRFRGAYNVHFKFAFQPGTAGTNLDSLDIWGSPRVLKQDAFALKNPGTQADDALNITASNAEVWVRPLILTGTTAPSIMQAIQDPGVDLAEFVTRMYA